MDFNITEALAMASSKFLTTLWYLLVSVFFACVSIFYNKQARTLVGFLVAFSTSTVVGVLAGNFADKIYHQDDSFIVVALAALIANDLVKFILAATGFINSKSATIFDAALKWFQSRTK